MGKKRKSTVDTGKSDDNNIDPKGAKFVLFIFGIGPIIIIFLFLSLNGFFD